jgi:hypothetical protein
MWGGSAILSLGAGLKSFRARAAGACAVPSVDPEHFEALHYAEASSNPQRLCEDCNYFESRSGCGNCRILHGLVNPKGTCDSWSAKAG